MNLVKGDFLEERIYFILRLFLERKATLRNKGMSTEDRASQQNVGEIVHALSGAGAGVLSLSVTYPLLTISTKLQSEDKNKDAQIEQKKSAKEIIKSIYAKDGLLGYYAGLESAVYGIAVTNFVYYYFYELAANSIKRVRANNQLNTLQSMATGAVAGSITAIVSNPIWIANTRMTVTKSQESTLSTIIKIIQKDGPMALFNGLKPALILVLNPVIQYTVFEQLKNIILALQKKKNQKEVLSPLWAFVLGALGKLIATGATYPYLTLKTRLHLAGHDNLNKKSAEAGQGSEEKVTMISEALKIIKKDGVSGFYSGISYKLVQSILSAAFLFFFKEGLVMWSVRLISEMRSVISMKNEMLKIQAVKK